MEGTRGGNPILSKDRTIRSWGLISWNDAKVFCDWLTNRLSPAD
jgi:hypothetical protein